MNRHFFALFVCTSLSIVPAHSQIRKPSAKTTQPPTISAIDEALLTASKAADLPRMTELLARGANVNASRKNSGSVTPIFLAIKAKSLPAVQLLIKKGANVNAKVYSEMGLDTSYVRDVNYTPLSYAAALDQLEIMRALFEAGAKLSAENVEEIFYVAALRGSTSAMQLLLEREKPESRARNASVVLSTAVYGRNLAIVKLLVANGADKRSKSAALLSACDNGSLDIAFAVLEGGADPNVKEYHSDDYGKHTDASPGNTPLIMLLNRFWPRYDSMEDLPYYDPAIFDGIAPEEREKMEAEIPKAIEASQQQRAQVAELIRALIAKGAKPDALSLGGYTALLLSLERGDELFVQALLDGGANPNFAPPPFPVPLHFLAQTGNIGKLNRDIALYSDGSLLPEKERKVRARLEARDVEMARALWQKGADPKVGANRFALSQAVSSSNTQLAQFLLQKGADPNVPFQRVPYFLPPLHRALTMTMTAAEAAKQEKDVESRYGTKSPPQYPLPLHLAAGVGNRELVRALLDFKANVNARDAQGLNALSYLAANGRTFIIRATEYNSAGLVNGMRAGRPTDQEIITPLNATDMARLSAASAENDVAVAQLLIEKGADVNAPSTKNQAPLSLAALNSAPEVVEVLLTAGAKPDAHRALFDLIQNGRRQSRVAPALVKLQLDLTESDRIDLWDGAAKKANLQATQMRATAFAQRARLMKIWGEQDANIASQLIRSGANLDDKNNDGLTPLLLAARLGQSEMVRALLQDGAKRNATNRSGQNLATQIDKYGSRHTALPLKQTPTTDKYETQMSATAIANRAALIRQTLAREGQTIIALIEDAKP